MMMMNTYTHLLKKLDAKSIKKSLCNDFFYLFSVSVLSTVFVLPMFVKVPLAEQH